MKHSFTLIAVLCAVVLQMQAATLHVSFTGSHTAPYTNWVTAANNIQAAVDEADSGDTVHVTNGTYVLTSEILVTNDILIESVNGPEVTIVDGDGSSRCFNVGACIISGLTITNGYTLAGDGGGILCSSPFSVATNCTISGNAAGGFGGGMRYGKANNCIISGNTASSGGGISHGTANNCTISGNTAGNDGGGLFAGEANNCTITGNTAGSRGGGQFNGTARSCLIVGNTASDGGGKRSGVAYNCTVVDNTASGFGGGLNSAGARNCIVWYNTASVSNDIYSGGAEYTCSPDVPHHPEPGFPLTSTGGTITNAPSFVDKDNGDYRLAWDSPCLNAGYNGYVSPSLHDLDGNPRIRRSRGKVDMGAYEFGEDYYAALNGSHTAPYTNWVMAATNIQSAVDAAAAFGGTVYVTNGTYHLTTEILVPDNITVRSVNGTSETIVDGGGVTRCFNLGNAECTVVGFTITNGFAAGNGGGIYCATNTPMVDQCVIRGNTAAGDGGGVYSGTVNSCLISGNTANDDGGGINAGTANNCTIVDNMAYGAGGGMYLGRGNNCIIWYNTGAGSNDVYEGIQEYACSPDVEHGLGLFGGSGPLGGSITNAPDFVDKDNGNYRLNQDSPCMNAGGNSYANLSATDLDENSRLQLGTVDMGAYEFVRDYYVAFSGSHKAPFTSWETAATNIQSAVTAAAGGGTVHVADGTYSLTAEITVTDGITVESVNGPAVTIVDGGGVARCFNLGTAECVLSGLTITNGSSADQGGGIYCTSTTPVVTNCTISGNTAVYLGGGMFAGTANNCMISGNTAFSGGGMISGTANNCTISDNTVTYLGGGMYEGQANNCTISGNTATNSGGGMYLGTANNCIVWYNTGGTSNDFHFGTQSHTCSSNLTQGVDGNITNAPVFVDKDNDNYRLSWNSPCVDVGNNASVVGATDRDGNPRIMSGTVDMGAYELIPLEHHYADLNGSHTAPFTNWLTAATNIQDAVDVADSGDTVHIANGTYRLTSEILVATDILIESENGPEVTIVDGNGTNRCFNLGAAECVISGLTITNGYSAGHGGGIYCLTADPVVTDCIISGNTANQHGGGMYRGAATHCRISGNTAGLGGGMYSSTATNFVVNNCMISGNTANIDGGGLMYGTANNCTISGNTASNSGGGMIYGTANNCVVWYNTAGTSNDVHSGTQNHTCSPDVTHGVDGNITNAPVFLDKVNGNHRLSWDSPCVNAGSDDYLEVWDGRDLDGAYRRVNTSVDMGAYEYDAGTADSDGDGMTDGWEVFYFGSATGAVVFANADLDPGNNGDEFIAGTNPTNAASYFAITNVAMVAEGVELQWAAVEGRVYCVNWTDSLTNGFLSLETNIAYPQNSYIDTLHAAEAQGFYDVEVKYPEPAATSTVLAASMGYPDGIEFDPQALVEVVWLLVAEEWLTDDKIFLDIEITGINAGFRHHGSDLIQVIDTTVLVTDGGLALIAVDWTADTNSTHANEVYTVCVQVLRWNETKNRYDPIGGAEKCQSFGPY